MVIKIIPICVKMKHKYGEFTTEQLSLSLHKFRKDIFLLLVIADPNTKENYSNINAEEAFENMMLKLEGLNELLLNPPRIISVMSLIERARMELTSDNFVFLRYRKLILDAGNEIIKLTEVGDINA